MGKLHDLCGQSFDRLTVVCRAENIYGRTAWECLCSCGEMKTETANDLLRGRIKSCGCLKRERASNIASKAWTASSETLKKHGLAGTRLYNVWKSMRQRCNNPNCKDYAEYGGRGICICKEWDDFQMFKNWAIEHGYDPDAPFGKCTIDRIDVNMGYSPENCRFVDLVIQANNRRKRRQL